jgi:hypothetical protein
MQQLLRYWRRAASQVTAIPACIHLPVIIVTARGSPPRRMATAAAEAYTAAIAHRSRRQALSKSRPSLRQSVSNRGT